MKGRHSFPQFYVLTPRVEMLMWPSAQGQCQPFWCLRQAVPGVPWQCFVFAPGAWLSWQVGSRKEEDCMGAAETPPPFSIGRRQGKPVNPPMFLPCSALDPELLCLCEHQTRHCRVHQSDSRLHHHFSCDLWSFNNAVKAWSCSHLTSSRTRWSCPFLMPFELPTQSPMAVLALEKAQICCCGPAQDLKRH